MYSRTMAQLIYNSSSRIRLHRFRASDLVFTVIHKFMIPTVSSKRWLGIILVGLSGCDGSIGVHGLLTDARGVPIAGGEVRISRPNDAVGFQSKTDAEGCFQLGGLVSPQRRDYVLTIISDGYESIEATIQSSEEHAVLAQMASAGTIEKGSLALLNGENPKELDACFSKENSMRVAVPEPQTTASNLVQWQCTNDLEVRCVEGACNAEVGDKFTPMSVTVDVAGSLNVCAYSGCWEGRGEVLESDSFLVVTGQDLIFSTSPNLTSTNENITVVVDLEDGIATLKAGEFVHPLLCQKIDNTQ